MDLMKTKNGSNENQKTNDLKKTLFFSLLLFIYSSEPLQKGK